MKNCGNGKGLFYIMFTFEILRFAQDDKVRWHFAAKEHNRTAVLGFAHLFRNPPFVGHPERSEGSQRLAEAY